MSQKWGVVVGATAKSGATVVKLILFLGISSV